MVIEINQRYFIFSLKYCQRKADLNTSEKSLVFLTIRHRKFHLYAQLSYTKIPYLRKNMHLRKDAALLHFHFKESSEFLELLFLRNERLPPSEYGLPLEYLNLKKNANLK